MPSKNGTKSVKNREKSAENESISAEGSVNGADTTEQSGEDDVPVNPRFGPMPNIKSFRLWTRMVLVVGSLIVVYFSSNDERLFARQKEVLDHRKQHVTCSESFHDDIYAYPGCIPAQCGRAVMDRLITAEEAEGLRALAMRALSLGGSSGGASILDLHSGALSQDNVFVNIYALPASGITAKDFTLYRSVKDKIHRAVAHSFALSPTSLYLTHPTFFSRLTADPPVTPHDEYWHKHVDKDTYKSFHYTSLLYLNDYGVDFKGGRFMFLERDNISLVIEPRKGRVSMFTSGAENTHWVERVKSGTRYALTVSFTCNKNEAISDPKMPKGHVSDSAEELPEDLTGDVSKNKKEAREEKQKEQDTHEDL